MCYSSVLNRVLAQKLTSYNIQVINNLLDLKFFKAILNACSNMSLFSEAFDSNFFFYVS